MNKKHNTPTELSYFKGILFVTLEDNYPEKVIDAQFIEDRTELAEQSYEDSIREGKTPIEAEEIAKDVLFRGLGFSKKAIVRSVLYSEFAYYNCIHIVYLSVLSIVQIYEIIR